MRNLCRRLGVLLASSSLPRLIGTVCAFVPLLTSQASRDTFEEQASEDDKAQATETQLNQRKRYPSTVLYRFERQGTTLFNFAAGRSPHRREVLLGILVKDEIGGDPQIPDRNPPYFTSLHYVCEDLYKSSLAAFLISYGACLKATTCRGVTPLHYSHVSNVDLLLGKKTESQETRETPGGTQRAVCRCHRGQSIACDVDARTTFLETPLHIAALRGHVAQVDKLIGYGADVNAQRKNGDTPLHLAVSKGQSEIVKKLIGTYGADVGMQNKKGQIPEDLIKTGCCIPTGVENYFAQLAFERETKIAKGSKRNIRKQNLKPTLSKIDESIGNRVTKRRRLGTNK
eukprot:gb/GECG01006162.1/.p1 GENE.gb/GECG01006162.1/~~gb/GECG01006162.1/.p1  ORF type:complete len:343 (+),score=26.11 gb/GECG01006162.1/:1-1029(+)